MRNEIIVALVAATMVLSALAGGISSKNDETPEEVDDAVNQDTAISYADFDLSRYAATLPSGAEVFNEITYASNVYGLRQCGTPTHDLYAQYAIEKMAGYGLETQFQEFKGIAGLACNNVLGFKWGENRSDWIVFGAHYDTFATAQGSYDNEGGCAAVLELAKVLSGYEFKKTLVFALWDCEEWGLYGSAHFVKECGKNISLSNFNYDCYGLNYPCKSLGVADDLKHVVGINGGNKSGTFNGVLLHVANEVMKIPADLQYFHNPAGNSDHASFGKHPYAYFYSDPASMEILCYPNVPLDTFPTYVIAAGGPLEMQKGLESPLVFSYYGAILYSECC